jgi:hypothetical protein
MKLHTWLKACMEMLQLAGPWQGNAASDCHLAMSTSEDIVLSDRHERALLAVIVGSQAIRSSWS